MAKYPPTCNYCQKKILDPNDPMVNGICRQCRIASLNKTRPSNKQIPNIPPNINYWQGVYGTNGPPSIRPKPINRNTSGMPNFQPKGVVPLDWNSIYEIAGIKPPPYTRAQAKIIVVYENLRITEKCLFCEAEFERTASEEEAKIIGMLEGDQFQFKTYLETLGTKLIIGKERLIYGFCKPCFTDFNEHVNSKTLWAQANLSNFNHFSMPFAELQQMLQELSEDIENGYCEARFDFVPHGWVGGNFDMLHVHYETKTLSNGMKVVHILFSNTHSSSTLTGSGAFRTLATMSSILKQIPPGERTYDPNTHFWTIPEHKFDAVKTLWTNLGLTDTSCIWNHGDLLAFLQGKEKQRSSNVQTGSPPKPEDFFYNTSQPVGVNLTKEAAQDKLIAFLVAHLDPQLKLPTDMDRVYKRAAKKLHPDLNGGDAKLMSELNMLWQQYQRSN